MIKDRKKETVKSGSWTLKGFELALAEALDILGIKSVRLGIKKAYEEHYTKEQVYKLAEIIATEHEIAQLELDLRKSKLILSELNKEYEAMTGTASRDYNIYLFMENLFNNYIEENPEVTSVEDFYNDSDIRTKIELESIGNYNLRFIDFKNIYEKEKLLKEESEEIEK